MDRFVLLYHECPAGYERPSHWDLMLEAGGVLRTWALPRLPRAWEAARRRTAEQFPNCAPLADEDPVAAEQLAEHRLDYLDLEGPLSRGRGSVRRIDRGKYEAGCRPEGDERRLEIAVDGELVRGRIALSQREGDSAAWALTCLD